MQAKESPSFVKHAGHSSSCHCNVRPLLTDLSSVFVPCKSIKQMELVLQSLCALQPYCALSSMNVELRHCCYALGRPPNSWPAIISGVCHILRAACLRLCFFLGGAFLAAAAGCCLLGREAAHVCCSTGHYPAAMPVQTVCLRLCFFFGGALLAAAAALPLPAAAFLAEGLPTSAAVVPSSFCTFMSWHTAICTVRQPLV